MANCDFNQTNTKFAPGLCTFAQGQPCHVCKESSLLEESLSETHTNIADVEAQRRALRSKMNALHDPITSKLPPEVISYIFVCFMETESQDDLDDRLKANSTVRYQWIPPVRRGPGEFVDSSLQLGTICRYWRQIVWSTPRLWTNIAADVNYELSAQHVELFTACLSRSLTLPLYVILWDDTYRLEETRALFQLNPAKDFLDVLLRHIDRVVDLDLLKLPPTVLKYFNCNSDPLMRPKLERLKISVHARVEEKIAINASWDRLTRVILEGVQIQDINIKWNNLTHVRVCEWDINACLEVLSLSPRLQYLSISTSDFWVSLSPSRPIIEHKALKYLELTAIYAEDAAYFLERAALPMLEEYKTDFRGQEYFDDWPINDVIGPYFTHLSTRLKRMALKGIQHSNVRPLIEVLGALPSLDCLDLEVKHAYESEESLDILLEHLAAFNGMNSHQGNFLPNLRNLYIHGSPKFNWMLVPAIFSPEISFPESALLADSAQTLEVPAAATTKHPRLLTSLRVDYEHFYGEVPGPLGRENAAQLLRLIEQGIAITVGSGPSPGRILQSWFDVHQLP